MFIEGKKFADLRKAASEGNEFASKILNAYRNDEDISGMLDEFFKPAPVEAEVEVVESNDNDRNNMSKLEKYLADNEITKDSPDYQEYVDEFNNMFPEENTEVEEIKETKEEEEKNPLQDLIDDEIEAIEGYDKYINEILGDTTICEGKKSLIITKIKSIREDEERHIRELNSIKECKEEEEEHL